jgi:choline-sulfatase
VIAWLLLAACGGPPEEAVVPQRPDVVLVTLDTTRADRLGSYGHAEAGTDTLDALAAAGRRFDRAYSPLPLTIPSHASIFTGNYPATHGIRENGDATLDAAATTLAEVLKSNGYATGASVAAYVTTRSWGFDQGFDAYFDELPDGRRGNYWHSMRPAEEVVGDAVGWLGKTPGPRFLWVHLYDAHFPNSPKTPWKEQHEGRPYDAQVAYMDDQIAKLVEAQQGRPTLFVVVGDHGEGLGDHGELMHGLYVYESTQRVPFIVSGPGIPAGEVVDAPVSLVDVMPTVLTTLGIPVPDGVDGHAVPGDPRPVYMEAWSLRDRFGLAPHVAVVDGNDKLISLPRPELYDVAADRAEEHDRSADPAAAERLAAMKAALDGFGFQAPGAGAELEPEVAAQLAELGYVDGGFTGDTTGPLPDPKDHKRLIGLSQRADRFELEGRWAEADELYATLVAENPEVNEFRHRRALVLVHLDRFEEGLAIAQEALARDPENPVLSSSVAHLLTRLERFQEASDLYQQAAKASPRNVRMKRSAVAAQNAADPKRGAELGLSYLQSEPGDVVLEGLVGVALWRAGDPKGAVPHLAVGVTAERPERDVAFYLAVTAREAGDVEKARSLLRLELSNHPRNVLAAKALTRELSDAKDWAGLIEVAASQVELDPSDPAFWDAWAQGLFNLGKYTESRDVLDRALAVHPHSPQLLLLDANLLKKEGHDERALARFDEAKAALAKEKSKP